MKQSFGSFLVDNRFVSRGIVESALQNQSILGGRLGTNLVEAGVLTLEQVEDLLSKYYSIPVVRPSELDQINPHLISTIPKRLVVKFNFLPISKEGNMLRIATMDPGNQEMTRELSGVLGVRVAPYISCEIRMLFYLEKYYKKKTEIRFRSLFYHYRKTRALGRDLPVPQTHEPGKLDLMKKGFKPLSKGEELTDDGFEDFLLRQTIEREAPKSTPPPPQPQPQPKPQLQSSPASEANIDFANVDELAPIAKPAEKLLTIADLDENLKKITERDQVGDLALRFAQQFIETVIIFTVNAGLVSGWNARSKNPERKISKDTVGSIIVPLSMDSVFQTLQNARTQFQGRLTPNNLNNRLLLALNLTPEIEILVIPIFLKKRMVNVLLADNGTHAIAEPSLHGLIALSTWLPRAYEHLILERKRSLGPATQKK